MPAMLELFSGTGSIGKAFKAAGWEVVSLDRDPKYNPTFCYDILEWDYEAYFPRDFFQFVWASPDCTQYSRARTTGKKPRDLEGADRLVRKCLEIFNYFECPYAFENPESGLLKTRDVVQGIPYVDTSYCHYGYPYRKNTRIWNSIGDFMALIPKCSRENPCMHILRHGKHPKSAQRGPCRGKTNDACTLDQLHSIPPLLCESIVESVDIHYVLESIDNEIAASYSDTEEVEALEGQG